MRSASATDAKCLRGRSGYLPFEKRALPGKAYLGAFCIFSCLLVFLKMAQGKWNSGAHLPPRWRRRPPTSQNPMVLGPLEFPRCPYSLANMRRGGTSTAARRVSPRRLQAPPRQCRTPPRQFDAKCLRGGCMQGASAAPHALRGVSAAVARRAPPRHQPPPRQRGVASAAAAGVQDVSAANVSAAPPRRPHNPQLPPRHQPPPRRQLPPRQNRGVSAALHLAWTPPRRPGGASRRLRGSETPPRRFSPPRQ